jgi:hypothetical protein
LIGDEVIARTMTRELLSGHWPRENGIAIFRIREVIVVPLVGA